MNTRRWGAMSLCGALLAALTVVAQVGAADRAASPAADFAIRTLSNRADLISDGDALVEVSVPPSVALASVKVALNGTDVTGAFVGNAAAHTLRGVVTSLKVGANSLVARTATGQHRTVSLTITNHPRGGPVLLGSQASPWICATPTAVAAVGSTPGSNASGLTTTAVDAACDIATEYKLFYHTTAAGCSAALPDPSPPAPAPANSCFVPYVAGTTPADLATTTTSDGRSVPYIVRVERGTLNRGIYDIAVLFDPARGWTALAPQPQWNGKVVYSFGASTGQPRLQERSEQNWADDSALSRGFMVVDNSVTDSLYNSNRVLVAETVLMMKEHIVDTYGEIKYTMGNGCSGGSIQQNTVSSIYPGLLDGIQPSCDFPDSITTGIEVTDCVLLVNYYNSPAWAALTSGLTPAQINAKKTAINGHLDQTACHGWYTLFGSNNQPGNYVPLGVVDNTTGTLVPIGAPKNNCLLPAALVYDPVHNPGGTRCGDPDLAAAVWGTTDNANAPGYLRARQTSDNVGVQYGLKALLSGAISAEEFVTLNEKVGGTDADSQPTAARGEADEEALRIAYRAGIVGSGKHLGKVAIIDSRGYDEVYGNLAFGQYGIHQTWRSFSERARIDAGNHGDHGNQVIWRYGTSLVPATPAQIRAVTLTSFLTMDSWLSNLLASAPKANLNSARTQAEVIAAKPSTAFDLCYLTGDVNFANPVTDTTVCDADPRLQKHASPRQVAGGPLTEDILKCQLKPINTADYLPVTFTAQQLVRLYGAFPDGVCDWSRPGVGQEPPHSPLTFAAGPGGRPLPPAPSSHGIGAGDD